MKEELTNNTERALDWWHNLSIGQKQRVMESWRITKDADHRKHWGARDVDKSESLIIRLYNTFVE